MEDDETCFFPWCKKSSGEIVQRSAERIIIASKKRSDNLHLALEDEFKNDPDLKIQCHSTCISSYTSDFHIERPKRTLKSPRGQSEPPPQRRRSEIHNEFNFLTNCFICGEICKPLDKKNPARFRKWFRVRTIEKGKKITKEEILKTCNKRNDTLSHQVQLRISGANTDLHAADARYHDKCFSSFISTKNIKAAQNKSTPRDTKTDDAFQVLVAKMRDSPSMWSSVDLYDMYCADKGSTSTLVSRKTLIIKLKEYFGPSLIQLNIDGCSSLFSFRSHLPACIKLVEDENENVDNLRDKISKEINELKKAPSDEKQYNLSTFTKAKMIEDTSLSLLKLISGLISEGKATKKSVCLSQIIQSLVDHKNNQTTLGLGIKLYHRFGSKELIQFLFGFGITCSYYEVLRFKASAVKYIGCGRVIRGLNPDTKLKSWFDNFDLVNYTPNGERETHMLAVEFQQQQKGSIDCDTVDLIFERLTKKEAARVSATAHELNPTPLKHFNGASKPLPPKIEVKTQEFKRIKETSEKVKQGLEDDFKWLRQVVDANKDAKEHVVPNEEPDEDRENEQTMPPIEWSGFMNALSRENDVPGKPTRFILGPLIDSTPSHPDTIYTTMMIIERTVKDLGQKYIYISADLQLYKVMMRILWCNVERWKFIIPIPGGMHTLMSFCGGIGTLMEATGYETLLKAAFGGITGIMNGKAWQKCLRAMRMVTTILIEHIMNENIKSVDDLEAEFEMLRVYPTAKLWINSLIVPTHVAHMFLRSERKNDILLEIYCLKRMIRYFWASGHNEYARYLEWYVRKLENDLDDEAEAFFLEGEHICRHQVGTFNGVPMDQYGEQTYIRYGKAKGGLVGNTLSPNQQSAWVLSFPVLNTFSLRVDQLFLEDDEEEEDDKDDDDDDDNDYLKHRHKEEGNARKARDAIDRDKIRKELAKYVHPLKSELSKLINIVNGCVASDNINVQDALEIGEKMTFEFAKDFPDGFYRPRQHQVNAMKYMLKSVKIGDTLLVFNLEKLYARMLVLGQKREVSLSHLYGFELAPIPPALFDEFGIIRKSNKSDISSKVVIILSVEEIKKLPKVDVQIFDGNELFYHVTWPTKVSELKNNIIDHVQDDIRSAIIFDKYFKDSNKSYERNRRAKGNIYPDYDLNPNSNLPKKDAVLSSSQNKKSLINALCEQNTSGNHLELFGENSIYKHEEADVCIISYLYSIINMPKCDEYQHLQVVGDDTDIQILLLYFVSKFKPKNLLITLKKFNGDIIDINRSVEALGPNLCQELLIIYALTGCDSVSYPYEHGKAKGLKVIKKYNLGLDKVFGDVNSSYDDVIKKGTEFFCYLYGSNKVVTMNELRYSIFSSSKTPRDLKSFPPTDPALAQHLLRAHLQLILWKSALDKGPPKVDITKFGWTYDDASKCYTPRYGIKEVAPPELLQLIACSCKSDKACSGKCSCKAAGLPCTSYCYCSSHDDITCHNVIQQEDNND